MKKILYLLIICVCSCTNKLESNNSKEANDFKKKVETFSGINGLIIGSKFSSTIFFKYFLTTTHSKEKLKSYNIDKLYISKKNGIVEAVYVTTYNDEILRVKFRTGKFSNQSQIESEIEQGAKHYFTNHTYNTQYYESYNRKVNIIIQPIEVNLDDRAVSFEYFNEDLQKKIKLKEKQIEDSIYMADYIKEMKQFH